MRGGGAILLIVAAGFVAWLAASNRLKNLPTAWSQLVGIQPPAAGTSATPTQVPIVQPYSAAAPTMPVSVINGVPMSFLNTGPAYSTPYGAYA